MAPLRALPGTAQDKEQRGVCVFLSTGGCNICSTNVYYVYYSTSSPPFIVVEEKIWHHLDFAFLFFSTILLATGTNLPTSESPDRRFLSAFYEEAIFLSAPCPNYYWRWGSQSLGMTHIKSGSTPSERPKQVYRTTTTTTAGKMFLLAFEFERTYANFANKFFHPA